MAVPNFDYMEDGDLSRNWAQKKGDEGLKQYWNEQNQTSLDGFPTNIMNKNV